MRRLTALALSSAVVAMLLTGCGSGGRTTSTPTPSASPQTSGTPTPSGPSQASSSPLPRVRGNDIAYTKPNHIWRVHADGSDAVQLTRGQGFDGAPAWSPDHTQIAFVHAADETSLTESALCVAGASGGRVASWSFHLKLFGLCYSPDGRRIAFTALRLTNPMVEPVAVFDPASGTTTVVCRLHDQFTTGMSVSWSPDGTRLLLGLGRQDAEGQRTGVLTLASGKLVWLRTPDACEAHWSPDGRSIVMTQASQDYTAVSIADTDGTLRRVLARGSGLGGGGHPVLGGCYSPDGSRVAFWSGGSIWTIGVDGTGRHKVIAGLGYAWSPR